MFLPIIIITSILILVHMVLIENYRRWFLKLKKFEVSEASIFTSFSIIIPARNEQDNIRQCLISILNQKYPYEYFEIIVVDDHSTDNTAAIVEEMQKEFQNVKLIQLHKLLSEKQLNSFKKKAIETAVKQANGDWIITTDADCHVTNKWLLNFAGFIQQKDPVFIAAPVKYINDHTFVSVFQCLDFMSLQGITAASVHNGFHTMCNGANLAYSKRVFEEVGGFKGIDEIASGDDMMLMHKVFKKYPKQVHYLHSYDSIVETNPMKTWGEFFNQRIRWASKADKFHDKRIIVVLAFIYLFNLSLVVIPILALREYRFWWVWIALLLLKTLIELRFMKPVATFFKEKKLLWWFPVMQPVHILYTVFAGWLGKFGKYTWKGRVVK